MIALSYFGLIIVVISFLYDCYKEATEFRCCEVHKLATVGNNYYTECVVCGIDDINNYKEIHKNDATKT